MGRELLRFGPGEIEAKNISRGKIANFGFGKGSEIRRLGDDGFNVLIM